MPLPEKGTRLNGAGFSEPESAAFANLLVSRVYFLLRLAVE